MQALPGSISQGCSVSPVPGFGDEKHLTCLRAEPELSGVFHFIRRRDPEPYGNTRAGDRFRGGPAWPGDPPAESCVRKGTVADGKLRPGGDGSGGCDREAIEAGGRKAGEAGRKSAPADAGAPDALGECLEDHQYSGSMSP